MKEIELKIIATGHKLSAEDSLMVLVSPQWAEYIDAIYERLEEVTGHGRHMIIPVPPNDLKVFTIQHPIIVEAPIPPPITNKTDHINVLGGHSRAGIQSNEGSKS